jgi:hypothetical protein
VCIGSRERDVFRDTKRAWARHALRSAEAGRIREVSMTDATCLESSDEGDAVGTACASARAVVVLERDEDLRESIFEILEEDGYVVLDASNTSTWRALLSQARATARLEVHFHIVDLTLADGSDVFDELRTGGWDQPIIAVAPDGTIELDFINSAGRRAHLKHLPPRQLLELILDMSAH